MIPVGEIRRRLFRIAQEQGVSKVVLWGVGKDFPFFVQAARQEGITPVAAVDSSLSWGRSLLGVPLVGPESVDGLAADGIIIASCSPGETENVRRELAKRNLRIPVFAVFEYCKADRGTDS